MSIFSPDFFQSNFIFYAIVVIFIASIIRGFAGFGLSAVMMLSLSAVYIPSEIIILNYLLEVSLSLYLLRQALKDVDWQFIFCIIPGTVIFIPIGLYLLQTIDIFYARLIFSSYAVIIALGLLKVNTVKANLIIPIRLVTGVIAGLLNGFSSMGGLFASLANIFTGQSANKMKNTMILYLLFVDTYALTIQFKKGTLTAEYFYLWLYALPIAIIGAFLGAKIFQKIGKRIYKSFVLYFIVFISLANLSLLLFS